MSIYRDVAPLEDSVISVQFKALWTEEPRRDPSFSSLEVAMIDLAWLVVDAACYRDPVRLEMAVNRFEELERVYYGEMREPPTQKATQRTRQAGGPE